MANAQWTWLIDRASGEKRLVPSVDAREADPALYEIAWPPDDAPFDTSLPVPDVVPTLLATVTELAEPLPPEPPPEPPPPQD